MCVLDKITHIHFCLYLFCYTFQSVTSGLRRPSSLACAVGHAAALALVTDIH